MKRSGLALLALVAAAGAADAAHTGESPVLSAPQIEEASAAARRAAGALARQNERGLEKTFDEESLVAEAVGPSIAARLTARQRRAVGDRMLDWIAGPFTAKPAPPQAQTPFFVDVRPDGADALVSLLVPVSTGYLKTTWRMRAVGGDWLAEDVILPDLARSLRAEAIETLGRPPIAVIRNRSAEARRLAVPRVIGIAGVIVVAFFFARRMRPKERLVLFVAALAPAVLFAADGYLAIARAWSEPIQLRLADGAPWQHALRLFQAAIRAGNRPRSRAAAAEAISLGAAPEPFHLVLGSLAEAHGDTSEAAAEYRRALAPPRPAPGAWAGLARLAVAAGRDDESVASWGNYFALVPPDLNSLFWLAVAQGHRHDFAAAQETIARALALDPSAAQMYELSARLYGAAGDASGAIARLREQQNLAPIDRKAIAADGNFAPIAENEAWKKFLDEKPPS